MGQLRDTRRLVKLVDELIASANKTSPIRFKLVGDDDWELSSVYVKEAYKKKYKKASSSQVNSIFRDATSVKHNYLRKTTNTNGTVPFETVSIETAGRTLLEGTKFFPWGLIKAWVNENGSTVTFLLGLGIALGAGVLLHGCIYLIEKGYKLLF
jgi:hypothetical protein